MKGIRRRLPASNTVFVLSPHISLLRHTRLMCTLSFLLLCLLVPHLTQSYWPTGRGGFDSGRTASTIGPNTLGAPLASNPLSPAPTQQEDIQVLVGIEGNVYTIVDHTLFALDGKDLHELWRYDDLDSTAESLQLQIDGTLFLGGVGLLDSSGKQLSSATLFSVLVSSSKRDFSLGAAACEGQDNCYALRQIWEDTHTWLENTGQSELSWLCSSGDDSTLFLASCGSDCKLLKIDSSAIHYRPSFFPGLQNAKILEASVSTYKNFEYRAVLFESLPAPIYYYNLSMYIDDEEQFSLLFGDSCTPLMALSDDLLYVTGCGVSDQTPYLYLYDASSGAQLWATTLDDSPITSLAVDKDGTVFAARQAGGIFSYSSKGLLLQSSSTSAVYSPVALGVDGTLYAFSGTCIYAFQSPVTSPINSNHWKLYLGLAGGGLAALVVLVLAMRRFCGREHSKGCCKRDENTDVYSRSAEEVFSRQEDYEPPLLSILDGSLGDSSSPSFPNLFSTFGSSAHSSSDANFKASGPKNPWGGSSSSSSASSSNPFYASLQ